MEEYKCIKCKEIWEFCPEDYYDPSDHKNICPHCDMPIVDMIKEIWEHERWGGLKLIFKILLAKF